MTWTLFLDDIRFPEDVKYDYGSYKDIVICRSMDDAVWAVKQYGLPSFISFDHDLADDHYLLGASKNEKTGYAFAKWLCDYIMDNDLTLPRKFNFYVHSMNPVGAENIRQCMVNFLKHHDLQEYRVQVKNSMHGYEANGVKLICASSEEEALAKAQALDFFADVKIV